MESAWFLTKTFFDESLGHITPVCAAYGGDWHLPLHSAEPDGWALCQMISSPHQKEAAREDPRIVVLPLLFDPRPVPDLVIATYAGMGAKEGMSLALLLATLAERESNFARTF